MNTRCEVLWTKRLKQVAFGAACALLVLAGAQGSARAEDDNEDSIWNLDTKIYRGFMQSLGLRSGTDEAIDYRERSPLVVPPGRDLPPPEATPAQPAAAWPIDPDQKRRKAAVATKRNKKDPNIALDRDGVELMPSELNRSGPSAARTGSGGSNAAPGIDPDGAAVAPSRLGYTSSIFSWTGLGFGPGSNQEVGTFTREPPREALTAPPPGYQTPSPAAPYGVTKRNDTKVKPVDDAAAGIN